MNANTRVAKVWNFAYVLRDRANVPYARYPHERMARSAVAVSNCELLPNW